MFIGCQKGVAMEKGRWGNWKWDHIPRRKQLQQHLNSPELLGWVSSTGLRKEAPTFPDNSSSQPSCLSLPSFFLWPFLVLGSQMLKQSLPALSQKHGQMQHLQRWKPQGLVYLFCVGWRKKIGTSEFRTLPQNSYGKLSLPFLIKLSILSLGKLSVTDSFSLLASQRKVFPHPFYQCLLSSSLARAPTKPSLLISISVSFTSLRVSQGWDSLPDPC